MPEPLSLPVQMVKVETIDTEGWGERWHEEEKHRATQHTLTLQNKTARKNRTIHTKAATRNEKK